MEKYSIIPYQYELAEWLHRMNFVPWSNVGNQDSPPIYTCRREFMSPFAEEKLFLHDLPADSLPEMLYLEQQQYKIDSRGRAYACYIRDDSVSLLYPPPPLPPYPTYICEVKLPKTKFCETQRWEVVKKKRVPLTNKPMQLYHRWEFTNFVRLLGLSDSDENVRIWLSVGHRRLLIHPETGKSMEFGINPTNV